MGDNYTITARVQTTEEVGTSGFRDVVRVSAETKPSGIPFAFNQPLGAALNASIAARAHTYSDELETIAATPNVGGVQPSQEVTVSQQLRDVVTIYVTAETDTGTAEGQFDQPFSNLDAADVAPKIVALHKSLLETLNL